MGLTSFCRSRIPSRRFFSFASHSLDSNSLFLYCSKACVLSGSPTPSMMGKSYAVLSLYVLGDDEKCWLAGLDEERQARVQGRN